MMNTTQGRPIHQGHNIKRFREMRGIKQEALAIELGDDWNQKRVSQLENKEVIDEAILEQVARTLDISIDAIKNYTDEAATTFFNTFNDNSFANSSANSIGTFNPINCNFNPTEEWRKVVDENRKLVEDNKALYERLLKAEQEKVAMLEKVLNK